MSRDTKRRIVAIAIAVLGVAAQLWADPDRCLLCGWCSGSEAQCGMCIVEAVQRCCSEYTPEAMAICDQGEWFVFCWGEGGPYVECGTLAL